MEAAAVGGPVSSPGSGTEVWASGTSPGATFKGVSGGLGWRAGLLDRGTHTPGTLRCPPLHTCTATWRMWPRVYSLGDEGCYA